MVLKITDPNDIFTDFLLSCQLGGPISSFFQVGFIFTLEHVKNGELESEVRLYY